MYISNLLLLEITLQYGSHQEELQKIRSSMRRKNREGSAPNKSFAERLAERQVSKKRLCQYIMSGSR